MAAAAAALLVLIVRPAIFRPADLRSLDYSLAAALAIVAFHLIPLPPRPLEIISPSLGKFEASTALVSRTGAWRPLSVDPSASLHALLVFASAVAVFWSARHLFHTGGIRSVARGVAICGLIASVVGILQDASRTRHVYWFWSPMSDGPPGFGPFINRNHFAAWAVMALALTAGYLAARTRARDGLNEHVTLSARLRRSVDLRTIWLLLSIALMMLGLVLSLSRSGVAAAAAAGASLLMRRGTAGHNRRTLALALAGVVIGLSVLWTGPGRLAERWQGLEIGQEGRAVIWRETMPIVRDFWIAGTGAGTYGTAMALYQKTGRDRVHFNQAHNHYLQVLAEGGILLTAICAVAAVLFIRVARAYVRADRTGMAWLRVGAAAGLVGLAVHSIWETAARMPANALLAAVLAALVLHKPRHRGLPHRQWDAPTRSA